MRYLARLRYVLLICSTCVALPTALAQAKKPLSLSAEIGYIDIKKTTESTTSINPIRLKALKETALELGARGALAWQTERINAVLLQKAPQLAKIFNFNNLLIEKKVLPPVITQSVNTLSMDNAATIRLASKTYTIVKPARFVTTPPTWRDYLWTEFAKPTLPHKSLLPTTEAEATVWNTSLEEGWKLGLLQAKQIFSENLARLRRDYIGIALYKRLLAQHMVSAPFVGTADMGITGDGQHLRIHDQVSRITSQSALEMNPKKWTPLVLTKKEPSSIKKPLTRHK
eukprot:TRINITY_DN47345_c0_g1_i1.p1 TRINITY_DN47345_c0_g1~~TRINITY_DN47345_c0_g1_i1.p1  ORF type:complete len:285 (+),score=-50.09 TRINITY_DN47345_c0_g1_i1:611-1465(+)